MPCRTGLLVEICSFCYFGRLTMARIPRRLQDLDLTMHDPEHVQLGEENLQGPPEIDNIVPGRSHESTSQIKIICKSRCAGATNYYAGNVMGFSCTI
uniref:Uncharacterized protein n=3 Tax=Aegilops tauschii subsp. strangulata TaxID=200361 RepID=A0A452Z3X5_AEGTS